MLTPRPIQAEPSAWSIWLFMVWSQPVEPPPSARLAASPPASALPELVPLLGPAIVPLLAAEVPLLGPAIVPLPEPSEAPDEAPLDPALPVGMSDSIELDGELPPHASRAATKKNGIASRNFILPSP